MSAAKPKRDHWAHWLWMAPLAIAVSPIGFIAAATWLPADWLIALVATDVVIFGLLFAVTNGGE